MFFSKWNSGTGTSFWTSSRLFRSAPAATHFLIFWIWGVVMTATICSSPLLFYFCYMLVCREADGPFETNEEVSGKTLNFPNSPKTFSGLRDPIPCRPPAKNIHSQPNINALEINIYTSQQTSSQSRRGRMLSGVFESTEGFADFRTENYGRSTIPTVLHGQIVGGGRTRRILYRVAIVQSSLVKAFNSSKNTLWKTALSAPGIMKSFLYFHLQWNSIKPAQI